MQSDFDTVVIGGGQGGALARMLAEGGQRVALIEKKFIGGSCTNVGCTPTKAHIAAAKAADTIRNSHSFGIHSELKSVDLEIIAQRSRNIVENFRNESEARLLRTKGLNLIYGTAEFQSADSIRVKLREGGIRHIRASKFVVAVGTKPNIPQITGIDQVDFLTHESALTLREIPAELLILGGGYIACEFAQMFARFGSQVTMIQSADQLLTYEDADIADYVTRILRESGISIVLGDKVTEVHQCSCGITARWSDKKQTFSHLLIATGQNPQTEKIGLEESGIIQDQNGYIVVDDYLKSSNDGVYALGDCKGGPQFTHIAYDDARILRDGFLYKKWRSIENRLVPYTVFLDPQLGHIGLTEREARLQNKNFGVVYLRMSDTARGIETNQTTGIWKVLVEKETEQILGGSFLSSEGGETMAVVQTAMMANLPYSTLRDGIFAHPTWAESLNNLFLKLDKDGEEKRWK